MASQCRNYAIGIILFLLGANVFVWPHVLRSGLVVTFFDVGQGDAVFIETPQGHQILIDGGPDAKVAEKVGRRMPFWDKTLDLVILTHPDKDHLDGLIDILESWEVEHVLWTGVETDTRLFEQWTEMLEQEQKGGARVFLVDAPQRARWTKDQSAFMDILYPLENLKKQRPRKTNDTSIVARLVFGSDSFLFSGDITKKVEALLVEQEIDIQSEVLKAPHHGSKTSSSESFLEAVKPKLTIIQVGRENRYGHPAEEVIERLRAFRTVILRTDQQGDIVIHSDGDTI